MHEFGLKRCELRLRELTISPPGEAIFTCVQSMAPMHLGNPAIAANSAAFTKHSSSVCGIRTNALKWRKIAEHTNGNIFDTEG